jgi:hypothetical protein
MCSCVLKYGNFHVQMSSEVLCNVVRSGASPLKACAAQVSREGRFEQMWRGSLQ